MVLDKSNKTPINFVQTVQTSENLQPVLNQDEAVIEKIDSNLEIYDILEKVSKIEESFIRQASTKMENEEI